MRAWAYAAILCLLLLVLAGCGNDSTTPVINSAPTIRFTFAPIAVPLGLPVDLTVAVSDEDEGDALTVTWDITRGTLTSADGSQTKMTWAVPFTLGTDTVTVSVTDGEATATTTEVLKVGTLVGSSPPASFRLQDSPYILRDDTQSPPRLIVTQTTDIDPGVEIFVDLEETIIDVTGTLRINGTASQPVVIRANDRTLRCSKNRGWWTGILVYSEGQEPNVSNGYVIMDHADISYADNGVHMRDGGHATIRDSEITCCGSNGVLLEGTGDLTIARTTIHNTASNGVTVESGTPTILPGAINITDCDISINGNAGVSLNFNDFPVFDNPPSVPVTIQGNRFEFNASHGILMKNWVWPMIEYNNFSFNGSGASNIRLEAPFHDASAPDSIDVSCNYWGAAISNQNTIENSIRDRLDTTTLGTRLLVKPWLNEDPYQAAVMPPCTGGTTP